jgi:uncharacterized SAM-binding protein YcdF (DUF218 family)
MYFILSKVLLFLISPFYWILALLIISLIVKKMSVKKRLFISAGVLFVIFSNPLLLSLFAKFWDYPPSNPKDKNKYSCAILLGGFASEDEYGNGYFNAASDRFTQAVKLWSTTKVSHVLVTGGNANLNPDQFREADWVKTQLQQLNIPDSNVLIESNSRNTIENAAFSKNLLEKNKLQSPYLLVTSAFHMRRAAYIFKKAGVQIVPYPCNYFDGRDGFSVGQFIPSPVSLAEWNTYIKEIIGYIVAHFK